MLKCRLCNSKLGVPFLSLGNSPLSNNYLIEGDLHKAEICYPLELYVCKKCFLVQLKDFNSPENIFTSDYAYLSSFSDTWLKHCSDYAEMMIKRFRLNKKSFVIEVASNDGYLLQYFKKNYIPVLGVEPAKNAAIIAIKKGISTDIEFFNTSYAKRMQKKDKQADLIICNNVLAHNPHLNDFVKGLAIALKPSGIITIEFPHLLKLIEKNQFDTIYHEHFSYFTLYTTQKLLAFYDLTIFDVDEIPTHGGSLRIYVKHKSDKSKPISSQPKILLNKERSFGLMNLKIYYDFGKKIELTKRRLLKLLIDLKNKDKQIVGYGAPAKGNTLLNYCGIRTDFIDYTVDRNPYKQGRFLPGSHISIRPVDKIRETKPDYVLILPWNIKDEIMEQMSFIREWGGKFIIPIPEISVT